MYISSKHEFFHLYQEMQAYILINSHPHILLIHTVVPSHRCHGSRPARHPPYFSLNPPLGAKYMGVILKWTWTVWCGWRDAWRCRRGRAASEADLSFSQLQLNQRKLWRAANKLALPPVSAQLLVFMKSVGIIIGKSWNLMNWILGMRFSELEIAFMFYIVMWYKQYNRPWHMLIISQQRGIMMEGGVFLVCRQIDRVLYL